MARYPQAQWRPISRYQAGGSSATPMRVVRRLILHTAVSGSTSLYPHMSKPGTATSHFYVDAYGRVEQYIDTYYRSSATGDANPDSISVETQDMGGPFHSWSGSNVPKWTARQVTALVKLAVWVHRTHQVPLRRLPSSRAGTRGIGWHRQGISGNYPGGILAGKPSGGQTWSSSTGKACPGDRRIRQVPGIITRARNLHNPRLDIAVLQRAWAKPGGAIRTAAARKAVRAWVKALRAEGYTVKGFIWRIGAYGRHVRRATNKFNTNRNLPYGRRGRPTWRGAKLLGFRPYRGD